jgi:hypothetical protein
MCYIDGQKSKYSVLNKCNRMLKYNIFKIYNHCFDRRDICPVICPVMVLEKAYSPIFWNQLASQTGLSV